MNDWMLSLFGGLCIGFAVSLMLFFNGRVTGISGILNGVLSPQKGDTLWRVLFLMGLIVGGLFLKMGSPQSFTDTSTRTWTQVIVAGVLVGFGTVMGSGCTSGHGVCGMSRLSMRSILATAAFIGAGMFVVWFLRSVLGGV